MTEEPMKPGLTEYDNANVCAPGEVTTKFATHKTIPDMHRMMQDAKPEEVLQVADAWERLHQRVAGGDGIKNQFDKAVDHILQHWEGEAADQFAKRAERVSKSLNDCGTYAQYTGMAMATAGETLKEIKPAVLAVEAPSKAGSVMDRIGDGFTRDDDEWRKEISKNQGAQDALDGHDGDLSAGRERQLEAAAKMEQLAVVYSAQTKMMGSWSKRPIEDGSGDVPGEPGGVAPVPVAVTPGGSSPSGAGTAVTPSRTNPGGANKGKATVPSARGVTNTHGGKTGTEVNGITGGTGAGSKGGSSAGVSSARSSTVGGPGASGGLVGGAPATGALGSGSGRTGGPGMVGRASGNRGLAGGSAGTGARAGMTGSAGAGGARGGAGGLRGGIGSGAGAGAGAGNKRAGSTAGSRGPLARQKGGQLDTPDAAKGAQKQGGSGLHSSRGGGAAGQRGRAGMLGGAGSAGRNADRRRRENEEVDRPDYLVEDEETWMPKRRDVNPPTIN